MMDSSKVLMLISTIALYKALRFITASLHASSPVATTSNNAIPISTVDSSSDIVVTPGTTKHDVFLSFRGEDTRDTFTSHLYEALCKAKIKTYMDHKLRKGEQISETLMKVIEESAICVIIFSKDYASSTWCLEELNKIMERKQKYGRSVIPIFYNVDPSNVRKQSGSYRDAFAKLEKRFKHEKEKVQKWRDALTQAASLSGWDSKNVRPESELIKKIVKDILSKLDCMSSCHFDEGLVGIYHHIKKIEELMLEARIVGIWGMGGIGKTTIAKVVFQKLKAEFESFSFIQNVREQLIRFGLEQLQEKCLKELLKDEDVDTYSLRSNLVKNRLQHKKILLVLDDVDDIVQVEDLINVCNWFERGSRIIVTSRDMQVLKNVEAVKTYHVQNMESYDALRLFSLKAFKQNEPTDESYMKLSERVLEYCDGNPLALIVLGCFLYGRRKKEWESALEKLKEDPKKSIFQVLRLSYDGLDDRQKNIFLDLACLFRERHWLSMDFIRDYYDFCIYIEINVLKERSLISVNESSGDIQMHNLIQKMGQEISMQQLITNPRRPIRLWKHDDVCNFFDNNEGAETIQWISLNLCEHFPKLKIIDVSYSDHLISLPYLSQAPNIEEVWAIGCENLVQIHSPTVLPKLEDICSNYSEKLRCVSIGRKMNGSVGLVAVYKGFDLLNLSFNKLTIKLFISDDHEGICGVQFKVVSVPFTNIENGGAIKLAGQSLRSLLPFVRIVRWEDMSESENFKNRFGTCQFSSELDNYNLERTVSLSMSWFNAFLRLRGVECGGRNKKLRREVIYIYIYIFPLI